uniref:Uncharacterized protein n=1 Tax=Rhizophora mucronata TaxID=61149 RepID=A0A2P2K164_RHIMU
MEFSDSKIMLIYLVCPNSQCTRHLEHVGMLQLPILTCGLCIL